MPQRSHSCSESTRTFHLQVYIFNASKACQHSTSAKSACEQCQHSPKFRASSAPIQGIIKANSVSHQCFLRASSPVRGWSQRSPFTKNNKVYINDGLRGHPAVLLNVKSELSDGPQMPC